MNQERIFLGIGGYVVALNRFDGHELWRTKLGGIWSSGFVTSVTLLDDLLYATSNGEITCLDPRTGEVKWHNGLSGLGTGFIAVAGGSSALAGAEQAAQTAHATAMAAATTAVIVASTTAASS